MIFRHCPDHYPSLIAYHLCPTQAQNSVFVRGIGREGPDVGGGGGVRGRRRWRILALAEPFVVQ